MHGERNLAESSLANLLYKLVKVKGRLWYSLVFRNVSLNILDQPISLLSNRIIQHNLLLKLLC